jgi:uncharacterized protein with von Willebrand factor type A (vWA) domain
MSMEITWNITVSVPQLDHLNALMEKLVDHVEAIIEQMARLNEGQAQQTDAIAAQLEAVVAEMQQYAAEDITEAQLTNLLNAVTAAADTSHKLAADIRKNTEQITGIVPDAAHPAP